MGKSFLMISGKGGVGKSTLTAALGVAAARQSMKVALIDGDIGLRSLDLMLGLQDKVLYDMADLVAHRCRLDQALIWHHELPDLCLMVGGQQARPKDFGQADLKKIINTLKKRFDLVLIDGPAGLGRGMRNFASLADEVVVCATPDAVSLRAAEKLSGQLYAKGLRPSLLLNRLLPERVIAGQVAQPAALAQGLDLPLLGVLEEDPAIYTALLAGKTAAQTGQEGLNQALANMVQRMLGLSCPLPEYHQEKLSFWRRFLLWLED